MKKIIAAAFAAGLLVPAFGINAKIATPEKTAKWRETLASPTAEKRRKMIAECCLDIYAGEDPKDFAEVIARCQEAVKKVIKPDTPNYGYYVKHWSVIYACQIACWGGYGDQFVLDAWKAANAEGNGFVYYLARWHYKTLGLTEDARFDIFAECIFHRRIDQPETVGEAVNALLAIAPRLEDEAKVKKTLIRLNRALTPNLLKDKSWEPVVAAIRSALETY